MIEQGPRRRSVRPGRADGCRLACLLLLWAGLASAQSAAPRLRIEAGPGYDTNVTRVEGDTTEADGLARLVVDLEDTFTPAPRTRLSLAWQGGGKLFYRLEGEDAFVQRLDLTFAAGLADWLTARLDLNVRDRLTRDPLLPRDYSRALAGPGVEARLGPFRLGVRALGERFVYKPDGDLDATALGGLANVTWAWDTLSASVQGGYTRRAYDGPRYVRVAGLPGAGLVDVRADPSTDRGDTLLRAGAGLRWVGRFVASLDYSYDLNDSNSFGGAFERHLVEVTGTVPLVWALVASAQVGLQRVRYDEAQFLSADQFVEDEGRSALTVRLERPLAERWAVALQGGTWFTPGDSGPDFSRQTYGLGLAYIDEE